MSQTEVKSKSKKSKKSSKKKQVAFLDPTESSSNANIEPSIISPRKALSNAVPDEPSEMTLISTDDTLATDELEYGFKPPEDFESIDTPITNIRYPYVEDDDKELWLIRVANNLPLSVLNNMKIQLPTGMSLEEPFETSTSIDNIVYSITISSVPDQESDLAPLVPSGDIGSNFKIAPRFVKYITISRPCKLPEEELRNEGQKTLEIPYKPRKHPEMQWRDTFLPLGGDFDHVPINTESEAKISKIPSSSSIKRPHPDDTEEMSAAMAESPSKHKSKKIKKGKKDEEKDDKKKKSKDKKKDKSKATEEKET